ncbi:MAG: TRM11 family SAM-dependent methyltransferase [Planctomycetota bacterium]
MPTYLYRVSFQPFEQELALCEAAEWLGLPAAHTEADANAGATAGATAGAGAGADFIFADRLIDLTNAAYLAQAVELYARAPDFDGLLEAVHRTPPGCNRYRIETFDSLTAQREPRVKKIGSVGVARALADCLPGNPDLEHPQTTLWALRLPDEWIFGRVAAEYAQTWKHHEPKPRSFSSALKGRQAAALVNLAAPPHRNARTFLDPCCGAGTVLVEAAARGLHVLGCDLSARMAEDSQINLRHFGYPPNVRCADATQPGAFDFPLGAPTFTSALGSAWDRRSSDRLPDFSSSPTPAIHSDATPVRSDPSTLPTPSVSSATSAPTAPSTSSASSAPSAPTTPSIFDAAVVDFPYGHFSPAAPDLYDRVLAALRPRVSRLVVVTPKPSAELLARHGFQVLRTATTRKSRLVRHIALAE